MSRSALAGLPPPGQALRSLRGREHGSTHQTPGETILIHTKTQGTGRRTVSGDANLQTATQRPQDVLEPIGTAATAMIEGSMTVNLESFNFVSERIRQGTKTQQEFQGCRSLHEIHSVQMKFFQTAVDQYSAEVNKLAKLGAVQRSLSRDA